VKSRTTQSIKISKVGPILKVHLLSSPAGHTVTHPLWLLRMASSGHPGTREEVAALLISARGELSSLVKTEFPHWERVSLSLGQHKWILGSYLSIWPQKPSRYFDSSLWNSHLFPSCH